MPRNAVNVPPHWSDDVTAAAAESADGISAVDDDDDGDDDNDSIFSARPAATRANT